MDLDTFVQLIGTLGFPIVMCCALLYYLNLERESHLEEMKSVKESLDRNTTVMTELKEMLKVITGIRSDE